jgi:L-fuconolactonase
LIESFGFERLLYASDWPVSEQTHRYPEWVAILDDLTASCSEAERRQLFRNNALAFYRLNLRPSWAVTIPGSCVSPQP